MERLKLQYQDEKVNKFIFAMWDLLNSVDEKDDSAEEFLAEIIFANIKYPAILASEIYNAIEAKKLLDEKISSGAIFETTPDEIVENQIDQILEERGDLEDLAKDEFLDK